MGIEAVLRRADLDGIFIPPHGHRQVLRTAQLVAKDQRAVREWKVSIKLDTTSSFACTCLKLWFVGIGTAKDDDALGISGSTGPNAAEKAPAGKRLTLNM